MSVLINSTSITLTNKTNHLIEIECMADQDESFHVKSTEEVIKQREEAQNWVGTLFEIVYGSKLKKVIINLKANTSNTLTVNSKSELEFNFEAKVKNSNEPLRGYLPISTEYQGESLSVSFVEKKGIWRDNKGNVVIVGKTQPEKQEIIINVKIVDSLNNEVFIDKYTPAFCQLTIKNVV